MQSILVGFLAAEGTRVADADPIICLSHADGRAVPQNTPDDHADCSQCMLCASDHFRGALDDTSLSEASAAAVTVSWHADAWRAPAIFKNNNVQPRGPPLTA